MHPLSKQWTDRERLLAIEILSRRNLKHLANGPTSYTNQVAHLENLILMLAQTPVLGLEAHRAEIERELREP